MNSCDYKATPLKDLRLPTQNEVACCGPVANTAAAKIQEKRWGTSPKVTTDEETSFKRGVPGT